MFVTDYRLRCKDRKRIKKAPKKIPISVEVCFIARFYDKTLENQYMKYFNDLFNNVSRIDFKPTKVDDNDGVDLRIIIYSIIFRISEVDVYESVKRACSVRYPYFVIFARENNINERLGNVEVNTFDEKPDNVFESGYFVENKENYPNGLYTLMYYHSLHGPAYFDKVNRKAIEEMIDMIYNNKAKSNKILLDNLVRTESA